jgi:hypothetical protein
MREHILNFVYYYYTASLVGKDLDIFAIGEVSLNHIL